MCLASCLHCKQRAASPRRPAFGAVALTVASTEFSIAAGQLFFGVAVIAWIATLAVERRAAARSGCGSGRPFAAAKSARSAKIAERT